MKKYDYVRCQECTDFLNSQPFGCGDAVYHWEEVGECEHPMHKHRLVSDPSRCPKCGDLS